MSALIHHQPKDLVMFDFWASAISHIGYTTWESSRIYHEEKAPILKRSRGTALSVVYLMLKPMLSISLVELRQAMTQ